MSRISGRNLEQTRQWLLAAGREVLRRHYTADRSEASRAPVPISVAEILVATRELTGGRELTTGAVAHAFETKANLLSQVAASLIAADTVIGDLRDEVARLKTLHACDGPGLRAALVDSDIRNMSKDVAELRHWFASHSEVADPQVLAQLLAVYEAFDELLVDLYAEVGEWEGRKPAEGLAWVDVAAALTALTEGVVLRLHLPEPAQQFRWLKDGSSPSIAVLAANGIWMACTEDATATDRAATPPPTTA